MTDLRNNLAKARDEWLVSPNGIKCLDGSTIYVPAVQWEYLKNRLESAFIAGWTAKEKYEPQKEKEITTSQECEYEGTWERTV